MIKLFSIFFALVTSVHLIGQDPHRFDQEIKKFEELSSVEGEDLVVFTGSSSVRFWQDLEEDCNHLKLVNTGFGGSHMSDLLYFLDQTVLRFKPVKVYIYEGDNDISAGKNPAAILQTTRQVANSILEAFPNVKIYFLSAKPSPSRWSLKSQYTTFNSLLKSYCNTHDQLFYVNVWDRMLDDMGRPDSDIFISDSLHMNRQGYLIWKDIICNNSENR